MSARSLLLSNSQNTNTSVRFRFTTSTCTNLSLLPFSLLSPLSFFTPSPIITFSITKLHYRSFPLLCPAFPPHSQKHNPNFILLPNDVVDDDDDDDDEEQVLGDCVVFEDGIFEDPYLQQHPSSSTSTSTHNPQVNRKPTAGFEIEPQNLVPEEWGQVVEEINLTKKERRKIAQDMEFGQRIEKNKRLRNVNLDEFFRFRNENLSQLKPLVVDNPTGVPSENGGNIEDGNEGDLRTGRENVNSSGNTRVQPKNPRWAVYGRGLDDITDFFNSGTYQPSAVDKREGRQKLFTKEEKFLMNARIPKLADATSQKWPPLHTLAASGEFYLLNNLLKHNVDINAADKDGLTALHKAISCKKQAITNYLLRESANPFVRDKDGASLMHYAVRTASSQVIKTLLLHNVEIDLQDNDGWTPLHLAVQSRRTDVVRLLLMKGADKTLKNKDGLTPLELCLYAGRDAKTYELVKLLKQLPRQRR